MKRHVELQRGPGPQRRTEMRRSRAIRGGLKNGIPEGVRREVYGRSGGSCEAKTTCNGDPGCDLHHIRKRSQGRNDDPSNLLLVCRACHVWCEQNPKEAHIRGVQYSAKWAAHLPDGV